MRKSLLASIVAGMAMFAASQSEAAVFKASFENLNGSQTIGAPVNNGDLIAWFGLIENQSGALTNSVTFEAGASTIDLSAAWPVRAGSMLTAFNIDLTDSANMLVASDTVQGQLGGFVVSTLVSSGLTLGNLYTLTLTGNSIINGNYDVKALLTPVPAAALLLATALGGLGYVGYRRKA